MLIVTDPPGPDPQPRLHREDEQVTIWHGDALDVLAAMPDQSVDAIVTDPPYGLEFGGAGWDTFRPGAARFRARVDGRTNPAVGKSVTVTPEAYVAGWPFQQWCAEWAAECLRVLKPGGHLAAFGGARTWHRLACALEDAGFVIRDTITWLYASGFPKSRSLADGVGTALKPAHEPILLARRPVVGTTADTHARWGTGGLNIDACRVPHAGEADLEASRGRNQHAARGNGPRTNQVFNGDHGQRDDYDGSDGRWPPNVLLSHAVGEDGGDACAEACAPGCPVAELDAQSGRSTSRAYPRRTAPPGDGWRLTSSGAEHNDAGGASRFYPAFRWCAKADARQRARVEGVAHPTVKPVALMRWLVRLVTPSGGLVVDPFAGSGTTGQAAVEEGRRVVLVEREAAYLPLIDERLQRPLQGALDLGTLG